MRSTPLIFVIALVLSLLLHAIALSLSRGVDWTFAPPEPPEPKPPEVRLVQLLPPEPPPPPPPPDDPIGEETDEGRAINQIDAPRPNRPREFEQEQAALSRTPQGDGEPSPPAPQPSPPTPPAPKPPDEELPPAPAEQLARATLTPTAVEAIEKIASSDKRIEEPDTGDADERAAPPPPAVETPPETPAPPTPPAPQASRPGDAKPEADRDSDPFGPAAAVEIEAGEVKAQSGRQVKITQPHLNLAGFVDSATIRFPIVLAFEIDIDDTGYPRRVILTRSSGSPSIDRAWELAMYKSWFEPIKARTSATGRERFGFGVVLK